MASLVCFLNMHFRFFQAISQCHKNEEKEELGIILKGIQRKALKSLLCLQRLKHQRSFCELHKSGFIVLVELLYRVIDSATYISFILARHEIAVLKEMGPFKKKIVGKYYYKTHSGLMINVRLSDIGRVGRMFYGLLTEHSYFLDMQTSNGTTSNAFRPQSLVPQLCPPEIFLLSETIF